MQLSSCTVLHACIVEPDVDLEVVNAVEIFEWLFYLWRLLRSAASVR